MKPGDRFSYLTVIKRDPNGGTGKTNGPVKFIVRCDCGVVKSVAWTALAYSRSTKSCGCMRTTMLSQAHKKHGYSIKKNYGSVEWKTWITWSSMHWRCYNENRKDYPRYGGRGIRVCQRWHKFENFLADMGHTQAGRSLGRIDNDKNYSPTNCEWQTSIEQGNNKVTNRILRAFGKSMTLKQWSRVINVMDDTIRNRLKDGWSVERALSPSLRRMKNNRRPSNEPS